MAVDIHLIHFSEQHTCLFAVILSEDELMILVFFPRAFQGLVFFVNLKHCSAKTRM